MIRRALPLLALALAPLTLGTVGLAPSTAVAEEPGIPVEITVIDEQGQPVPTASVRHPEEKLPRAVNTVDGKVTLQVLYLPDGSELVMEKGAVLELEVSAPGYENYPVKYVVRKRRNAFNVILKKLNLEDDSEEMDDPIIQFHRDRPRD
ncbi:MAG: hypothetical protein EP330_02185 [Deltaproteobacteria bacterium]|nr:MAG: hypothetical protein EP330_02185 [Deltaproteobacteria bacterium]